MTTPTPTETAPASALHVSTLPTAEAATRRLAELPFELRDERTIDGTARWMGMLGRFQVLAGSLALLGAVGLVLGWTYSSATAPEVESDTTPPLVRLGEVSSAEVGVAIAVVVAVGLLVLRGGVLLTDAAEDLEHHIHANDGEAPYLEDALVALAKAFAIDATLLALAGAALYWLGSLA